MLKAGWLFWPKNEWIKVWAHDHDYHVSKTIPVAHIYIQALLHSSSHFLFPRQLPICHKQLLWLWSKAPVSYPQRVKRQIKRAKSRQWPAWLPFNDSLFLTSNSWSQMETFGFQRILIAWPEDAAFEGRKRGTRVSCHGTNCVREFCSQLVKAVNYKKRGQKPNPKSNLNSNPNKREIHDPINPTKKPVECVLTLGCLFLAPLHWMFLVSWEFCGGITRKCLVRLACDWKEAISLKD